MVKVRWYPDPWIHLDESVRRRVEEQVEKMDLEKVRRFGEYEETGDEYVLPEPDPYEGLYVKVAKHEREACGRCRPVGARRLRGGVLRWGDSRGGRRELMRDYYRRRTEGVILEFIRGLRRGPP